MIDGKRDGGRKAGRPGSFLGRSARLACRVSLLFVAISTVACNDSTAPRLDEITWESATVRFSDGSLIVEDVSYRSGGLLITGRVCRPAGGGPHPILFWNHGGFDGIAAHDDAVCEAAAELGYAAMLSSYRGEDASDGEVEVCLGEVDDVLAMIEAGRTQRYADPRRVVMAGASHGGCITLGAIAAGAPVHAAASLFAPTDWSALHAEYADSIASGSAQRRTYYQGLIDELEEALGGSPQENPQAWAARSPALSGASLAAWGRPLLIAQGTHDDLVLPSQACLLAQAVGGTRNLFVQPDGTVAAEAPAACAPMDLQWSPGPRPTPGWPDNRYLLMYAGAGHDVGGTAGTLMVNDLVTFLRAKTPRR